jgi:Uma2 family endonuclease
VDGGNVAGASSGGIDWSEPHTAEPESMKRATYEDVLNAPEHKVAEILDGELFLSPRPAPRHAVAHSRLLSAIGRPFDDGLGGPGGWWILTEPELHFGEHVLVPDIAGWLRERMPAMPDEAFFSLAPDWVCEVLSPSTERIDRTRKLRIYGEAGVLHLWLVKPTDRTLEVLRFRDGAWSIVGFWEESAVVKVEPFEAIELELARLWVD